MSTITISLEGGGQLTVQTSDQTPLNKLENALRSRKTGDDLKVRYQDADILILAGVKVLGVAVVK